MDLLKEIAALKEKIENAYDEAEKVELKKQLRDKELALSLTLERNRGRSYLLIVPCEDDFHLLRTSKFLYHHPCFMNAVRFDDNNT